jgi:hypothetical protein
MDLSPEWAARRFPPSNHSDLSLLVCQIGRSRRCCAMGIFGSNRFLGTARWSVGRAFSGYSFFAAFVNAEKRGTSESLL